ncbi:zinc finger protein 37-like [Cydia amplana]|uniref:zinc finger protein 37-like n=1 Tax=Cydia amplana TaxID=1869771 RepID=UPI002FE56525
MNIQNVASNEDSLLACRACLITDCKLYNIHDYQLGGAFARISGVPVHKDGLPQHLCTFCSAQVARFEAFREKVLRSHFCMRAKLCERELDTNTIRTIDRAHFKLVNNLTFTKPHVECINLKTPEDIKNEPNADTDDTKDNIVENPDLKQEDEKNDDTELDNDAVEDIFILTDVEDIKKRRRRVNAKKKMKLEKFDDDDDVKLVNFAKKRPNRKKESVQKKNVVKKRELKSKNADDNPKPKVKKERKLKEDSKRKFRNPENGYMPVFDFATFENAFEVRVVTLSKEDQLEEIATRKESANYLESPFQCHDCGKGFLAEEAYNNHQLRHSPSAGPYACEVCKVRFNMQCRRQEHQDMHRLKFFCKNCSFVSRNRHQARRHYDMHAGKTFECKHCGKMFNKSSTYLSHVRLAHPDMHVSCDLCGETFVGQAGLKQHKAKMHSIAENIKPQKFECGTCSATFLSVEALNRHTDTAGEHRDLRPCEQCGENCASEHKLQEHVTETHPKETYRCEECNMSFKRASAYELHHRRKHLGQRFSAAGRHVPRRTPGHFVCEQCGRVLTVSVCNTGTCLHTTCTPAQAPRAAVQRRRPPRAAPHARTLRVRAVRPRAHGECVQHRHVPTHDLHTGASTSGSGSAPPAATCRAARPDTSCASSAAACSR